jgi:ABC-2 type transport system permease protein
VLIPLGALSLAGFGALLGTYAKDGPTANILGNALIGFVTFLSPTMIPLDSMPGVLRITSYFVPTTYVSDAFRAALQGNIGLGLAYDVLILVLFTAFFMALVHRKLDWRGA